MYAVRRGLWGIGNNMSGCYWGVCDLVSVLRGIRGCMLALVKPGHFFSMECSMESLVVIFFMFCFCFAIFILRVVILILFTFVAIIRRRPGILLSIFIIRFLFFFDFLQEVVTFEARFPIGLVKLS